MRSRRGTHDEPVLSRQARLAPGHGLELPDGSTGAGLVAEDRSPAEEGESAMTVLFKIDVSHLKTAQEGTAYCAQLAEAIVELPLNENCGIERIVYSVPKRKGE